MRTPHEKDSGNGFNTENRAMRFWTKAAVGVVALAVPLTLGFGMPAVDAQVSHTVAGEAYGTQVDVIGATQERTPHARLEGGAVMDEADAPSVSVPAVVAAENLFTTTTGAASAFGTSAESSSTLENVDILDGLITADGVVAIASAWLDDEAAGSDAGGSGFAKLVVNGQVIDGEVAPNTGIDVPGVGTVILNEQIATGDGVNEAGLTVNMIHVVLKDALTGATTGEIVVGSAHSAVAR